MNNNINDLAGLGLGEQSRVNEVIIGDSTKIESIAIQVRNQTEHFTDKLSTAKNVLAQGSIHFTKDLEKQGIIERGKFPTDFSFVLEISEFRKLPLAVIIPLDVELGGVNESTLIALFTGENRSKSVRNLTLRGDHINLIPGIKHCYNSIVLKLKHALASNHLNDRYEVKSKLEVTKNADNTTVEIHLPVILPTEHTELASPRESALQRFRENDYSTRGLEILSALENQGYFTEAKLKSLDARSNVEISELNGQKVYFFWRMQSFIRDITFGDENIPERQAAASTIVVFELPNGKRAAIEMYPRNAAPFCKWLQLGAKPLNMSNGSKDPDLGFTKDVLKIAKDLELWLGRYGVSFTSNISKRVEGRSINYTIGLPSIGEIGVTGEEQ